MSNSAFQIQSPQANFSPQYLPWYTRTASCSINSNEGAFIDSTTGPFTITLPASPAVGDRAAFLDKAGYCQSNIVTIARNGNNIMGAAQDLDLDIANGAFELIWVGGTMGWKLKEFPAGAGALGSVYTYKNLLINGDFQLDQRNAAAAKTVNSTTRTNCMDRWQGRGESADGVFTVQQVTSSVPASGAKYAAKITVSTADAAIGVGQFYYFAQPVEGNCINHLMLGTANAKKTTLTFWIRSSLTGTFAGFVKNWAGTRSYPFTFTISVADTWEKKTVYIAAETSGTWVSDTAGSLMLGITLGCGTTYQGTANAWGSAEYYGVSGAVNLIGTLNATMYLSDVQLEVGELATDFERLPTDEVLRRCQRYYEKSYDIGTVPGTATTTGMYRGFVVDGAAWSNYYSETVPLKVIKRATPVFSYWDGAGNASKITGWTGAAYVQTDNQSPTSFTSYPASSNVGISFALASFYASNGLHWATDAEL